MKYLFESFEDFLNEAVNEARKYDVLAAVKNIRDYNRGKKTDDDFEDLAKSIIKNLGYKDSAENIENVIDHLASSTEDEERIPEDKDLVEELYDILESVNEASDLQNEISQEEFGMDYDQLGRGEKEWVDDEIDNRGLNESRVQYKRKYTERNPAMTMNTNTKIRTRILETIADGVITEKEILRILKELKANPRWIKRNSHLFKVTENGICLSTTGRRMLKQIQAVKPINETGIPEIPFGEWELTDMEEEEGRVAVAKYRGKYYATTAILAPGSVDEIDDIIDFNTEEITMRDYKSLL